MTEITEHRGQTEQQNRQNLLKDLSNAIKEKYQQSSTYTGELINGIIAPRIIIRQLHAKWSGGRMAQVVGWAPSFIEILSPKEKSPYKDFFSVYIEQFNTEICICKFRKKGLIPKYNYYTSIQASGKGYQRLLNETHGDPFYIDSPEGIARLTKNIKNWKKV